ncbi:glycosyl hydrolase [Cladorrhinum sp. PSN259]|nr:glycosyl hydrolase [Cladorrhinum sp. PSN259]
MFFSKGAVILATLSLFTGELLANGEQVYMAVSNNNDPRSWTTLNGGDPILTSNVGMKGIRDPSLIMAPDRSKYYLISTDLKVNGIGWNNGYCYTCNGSRSFVIWESTDLINWSGPSHREVAPSNAGMAWAPDAIWHPGKQQYMVFWTSKLDGKQELHNLRSFTPDFKTFSPAETWVDLGMDNTIALDRAANKYYMISKNGPKDGIQQNVADSVDGPWKLVAEEIGLDKLPAGEGPLIFQNNINPAKWHLWIDDYKNAGGGRYVPFETEDLAAGRWKASEGYKLPSNPRHGYVVSM